MEPTHTELQTAKAKGEEGIEFLSRWFTVVWAKKNTDKRAGTIDGWDKNGVYLGEFKRHHIAIEKGAAVTRVSRVHWFVWEPLAGWYMKCLLCNLADVPKLYRNLVEIQEHAMQDHGYTQADHRQSQRREVGTNHFIWSFPDGREWMEAEKIEVNASQAVV
jgi:hypothetical protein